jgi:hypothetical protein
MLTISGGTPVYLHLPIEASGTGRGALKFEFAADGATAATETAYRILELPGDPASQPATTAAAASIRINRTMYVVAAVDTHAQAAFESEADGRTPRRPSLANQPRLEISDERALPVGTLILVEETIDTDRPWTDVSWSQNAPANCVTRADSPREFRALSAEHDVRDAQYSYRAVQLPAGRTLHQYTLVVSRPGLCHIAAPTVRSAGATLRTQVTQPASRIVAEK